jgi:hypothetical protein
MEAAILPQVEKLLFSLKCRSCSYPSSIEVSVLPLNIETVIFLKFTGCYSPEA